MYSRRVPRSLTTATVWPGPTRQSSNWRRYSAVSRAGLISCVRMAEFMRRTSTRALRFTVATLPGLSIANSIHSNSTGAGRHGADEERRCPRRDPRGRLREVLGEGLQPDDDPGHRRGGRNLDCQRLPLFPVQAHHPLHALRAMAGGAARSPRNPPRGDRRPRRRLERLLLALWRELPSDTDGFANNVMQALSTNAQADTYDPRLRELFQRRVARWLAAALELSVRDSRRVAGVVLMAFDGFAMNVHLKGGIRCDAATARLFSGLLGGAFASDPSNRSSASSHRAA